MPPTRFTYDETVIGVSAVMGDLISGIKHPFSVIKELHHDKMGEVWAIIQYPPDGKLYRVFVKYEGPE